MHVRPKTSVFTPSTIALTTWSLAFAGMAGVLTAVIFLFHWNDSGVTGAHPRAAPPDWVVGVIWIILFAMMGIAYGIDRVPQANESRRSSDWIIILFLTCAAYPFYTAGLSSRAIGLAGNVVTLVLSIYVQLRLLRRSRLASILLIPLSLWLGFACFLLY